MTSQHLSFAPMPEAEYTGQSIAAVIAVPIVIVCLLAGCVWLWRAWRALRAEQLAGDLDDYAMVTPRMAMVAFVVCSVAAVGSAVALWWGMYPWKAEYHEWRPVSGTVATVDSRLMSSGSDGGMEDKFVVTFAGDGQQYGILDTRAASIEPGDHLTVTCVRRWQWSGTHGFDCNFVTLTSVGER